MTSNRRASLSLGGLVKDLHPAGVHETVLPGYMTDPVRHPASRAGENQHTPRACARAIIELASAGQTPAEGSG